jgi:MarR family transcriptional regulator, organic hydroperoxide resistance regulator
VDPLYELTLSVKAIHREIERRLNMAMQPLDLTGPQAEALLVIGQSEPLSLTELGELLIAEAGYPSRLVDRLVHAGLVERRPSEDDRRRVVLTLTPRGRRTEQRVAAAAEGVLRLSHELIDARGLDSTLKFLRRLVQLTPNADLIARRKQLANINPGSVGAGRPDGSRRHSRDQ